MSSEIRLGHLISPFGPGSIYTDKNGMPTVICGLDYWFTREVDGSPEESSDAKIQNTINEPRLSELLNIKFFRRPPEYYYDSNNPEMSRLTVQGHRFPRWYINTANGRLKRFNLETRKLEKPEKGAWRPVRFVAVCESGHMSEFPWKEWAKCSCDNSNGLTLHDSGGADLSSVRISCSQCNNFRTLAGATVIRRENETIESTGLWDAGIQCTGQRPWLGERASEKNCQSKLAGVMINQSNIYFANTVSAIFLPTLALNDEQIRIQDIFAQSDSGMIKAKLMFSLGAREEGVKMLRKLIEDHWEENKSVPTDDTIFKAYDNFGKGENVALDVTTPKMPDTEVLAFRRAEYNILRNKVPQGKSNELRVLPSIVPDSMQAYFNRVNLIERLRETRVFCGFDRLAKNNNALEEMPDRALNQLFLKPPSHELSWLPAIKNYGEGIYLELSEQAINIWLEKNSEWLERRFSPAFINRMLKEPMLLPPNSNINWQWAARYQLLHTLSHILINQLVFECGYSTSALKERLFVSNDSVAPMAGILIYTASGDSEGSLGGLVRLGRPELFENMVKRAVSRASWCSADPVCSENMGGTGTRQINLAACHACVLLPETACETINNGLDRATLVGLPENRDLGLLANIIERYET